MVRHVCYLFLELLEHLTTDHCGLVFLARLIEVSTDELVDLVLARKPHGDENCEVWHKIGEDEEPKHDLARCVLQFVVKHGINDLFGSQALSELVDLQ